MKKITITKPDDFHLHLRDEDLLKAVLPETEKRFKRAIVMPNLVPPIVNTELALAYRKRIISARSAHYEFQPLMTLYLTQNTSQKEILKAKNSRFIFGAKLYPAGATTNSDFGVNDINALYPLFETMQECGLPLLIHGEIVSTEVDFFDREALFIEKYAQSITKTFPELRVVLEHITTQEGVDFVTESSLNVAATITPQHLLLNRNALFQGGIKPHHYCLPPLKREVHRQALVAAATSGNPKFFLGTDSAPHTKDKKESDCGCAGCYTAMAGIELYAQVFDQQQALDKLEDFSSKFGAKFYNLPLNQETIALIKKPYQIPGQQIMSSGKILVPFFRNEVLEWSLETS